MPLRETDRILAPGCDVRVDASNLSDHRCRTNDAADDSFRTLEDGRTIFYPAGVLGRLGYVVASDEQGIVLRERLTEGRKARRIACVVVPFIWIPLVYGVELVDWPIWLLLPLLAGTALLDWGWLHLSQLRITRTMERVRIPNMPMAHWRAMGRRIPPAVLFLRWVLLACFVGAGLFLTVRDWRATGIVVFGTLGVGGLVPITIALHSWWRARAA
jgi:hypothetical protein